MTHFLANLNDSQRQQLLFGIQTPYYLLDENALIKNLKVVDRLCQLSGAKALLALKCFATWGSFEAMKPYLHGTTSSSVNEARLGKEEFGGETHAYSVAYNENEAAEALEYADKIIFNSINQLNAFGDKAAERGVSVGLRINPKVSNSSFLIADPSRPFSRLGEHDPQKIAAVADKISGAMLHYNCENADFEAFCATLDDIEARFGDLFARLEWISLGGGIHFIAPDYPVDRLAARLKAFAEKYQAQIYLEPGEACVHNAAVLVTSVLDTLDNGKPLAVVDASIEAHMLDLLIYRQSAPLAFVNAQSYRDATSDNGVIVYGRSCLSGDIFGEYALNAPLQIGDKIGFGNAAAYTMVKKNWFNGVDMPSIVIAKTDGSLRLQRCFDYDDYKASLS